MPSILDQLLEQHGMPVLEDLAGVPVTYQQRGSVAVSISSAIFQDVVFELVSEEGFSTLIAMREWVIPVATLATTRSGALLVEADGTQWMVASVGDKPHQDVKPGGYRLLVRTKKVS
jgi:hypothetical protein